MERKWETPKVLVQEFESNEYVAACYNIKCSVDAANNVERGWPLWVNGRWTNNYAAGQTHAADRCGAYGSYYVIDDNDDGSFDRMIEISPDLGRLSCTLMDSTYSTTQSWSSISEGDYIYWTTTADGRTWHHQGSVAYQDTTHPNRS